MVIVMSVLNSRRSVRPARARHTALRALKRVQRVGFSEVGVVGCRMMPSEHWMMAALCIVH